MTRTPTADGRGNACRPRPNGNAPRAARPDVASHGVTLSPLVRWRTISTNGGTALAWSQWGAIRKAPARKACRTLRATCGSGWQTGMTHTITRKGPTGIRRAQPREPEKSSVVLVGNRRRPFSAQRTVSTAIRAIGITALGSVARWTPWSEAYASQPTHILASGGRLALFLAVRTVKLFQRLKIDRQLK